MSRETEPHARKGGRWTRVLLWVLAIVLSVAAMGYQRRTGPSHEMRAEFDWGGETHSCRLIRSEEVVRPARVEVPRPGGTTAAELHFRRYPTADEFRALPMRPEGDLLVGFLPPQPAAGKLEYFVVLRGQGREVRIPADEAGNPIIRFTGVVPRSVLAPHIIMMILSIIVGLRAGLAALFTPGEMRRLAWITVAVLTVGGMILGPIVQKFAFGAYWTGFPWGYDLTDNKTLVMWLGWLIACGLFYVGGKRGRALGRAGVIAATVIMIVVYLIPHSARGSELDYEQLDRGVAPEDAVKTG
jgi:hypothetical protein